MTINEAFEAYLEAVLLSRSENTVRTYRNALQAFSSCLVDEGLDLDQGSIEAANEDWIAIFAAYLKSYAPSTERLYLTAAAGWFEFLAAENLVPINHGIQPPSSIICIKDFN